MGRTLGRKLTVIWAETSRKTWLVFGRKFNEI